MPIASIYSKPYYMKSFSQFKISVNSKTFVGDKIKTNQILNQEIIVLDFKIEDSKVDSYKKRGAEKCLYLQISIKDVKFVVFTSSGSLMEMILQVDPKDFPFTTRIIEKDRRFLFT